MLAPDTILRDRYVIIRSLGSGGQGHVYEARDNNLARHVAIKEALLDQEEFRYAFTREAKLLANLRHQAFPKVAEYFSQKDTLYMVMELIPGEDLEQQLASRRQVPFELDTVLRWADVLLEALDYLHNFSLSDPIIHRDIKPGNIKLTERGEIVLLDFGLARGSAGDMSTMTSKRSVIGYTPSYAPPEQSLRHPIWAESLLVSYPNQLTSLIEEPMDARGDLYSLGATLYRLITGIPPPDSPKRIISVWSGGKDPLIPANQLSSSIPSNVANVLELALALDRRRRFDSADAMRRAMRNSLDELAPRGTPTPANQPETILDDTGFPNKIFPAIVPNPPSVKYGVLGKCDNSVRAVAFSRDGKWIASGSNDNAVRLWDTVTGEMRLLGYAGTRKSGFSYVTSVSFAPDGGQVASAGNDKAIWLWDVNSGEKRILGKYRHELRSVVYSPDGEFIACGSNDGSIQLWDIETEQVDNIGKCEGVVWTLGFSPDGGSIAAESDDRTIRIWNLHSRQMTIVRSDDSDIRSLCFSPDGESIVAAGSDQRIRVWDLRSGESEIVGSCQSLVRSVSWSQSGNLIASGSDDSTVRVWDLRTRKCRVLGTSEDVIASVSFSADEMSVASGSWDNTVRLWKVSLA